MVTCIDFANTILMDETFFKGEQKVYYSMSNNKMRDYFYLLTYISEHVTLVQLMDSLGNANHYISVPGYWIFNSDYENALVLNRESLETICAPYIGEKKWLHMKQCL